MASEEQKKADSQNECRPVSEQDETRTYRDAPGASDPQGPEAEQKSGSKKLNEPEDDSDSRTIIFNGDAGTPVSVDGSTIISSGELIELSSTQELPNPVPEALELVAKLPPRTRLAHFEIESFIGGGGMGNVYRAIDTALDRPVALKVLTRNRENNDETIARFINEAKSAARLNHENIAQVYFAGEDQGLHYIVFEFIEGVNVKAVVERHGTLSLPRAISYALQIAQALKHAAQHGVVHRDIKPSNILITPEDHAKLIDMGLARLRRAKMPGSDLTASGITLGTFDYISPEQARDPRLADTRSDIYSLGCTLFYMLAGRPPFPEGTVLQKLLQHQGDEPPDIRTARPEVPENVSQVIRKMMSKDPRQRYQEPDALIRDLVILAERFGLQPIGPSKTLWLAPRRKNRPQFLQHLPWFIPTLLLLIISGVLATQWNMGETDQDNRSSMAFQSIGGDREFFNVDEIPRNVVKIETNADGSTSGGEATTTNGSQPEDPNGTGGQKSTTDSPGSVAKGSARIASIGPDLPESELFLRWPQPLCEVALVSDIESLSTADYVNTTLPNGSSGLKPGTGATNGNGSATSGGSPSLTDTASSGTAGSDYIRGDIHAVGLSLTDWSGYELGLHDPKSDSAAILTYSPQQSGSTQSLKPVSPNLPPTPLIVLTVDPTGQTPESFSSLASAIEILGANAEIELRFDGQIVEHPMVLARKKLTIRAADGFKPTIMFTPTEDELVQYSQNMFTLMESDIEFRGVNLTFDVPQDVAADRWSFFELRGDDKLQFDNCDITLRNADKSSTGKWQTYHQETSFFRIKPGVDHGTSIMSSSGKTSRFVDITLRDTLVRGEGVVLRNQASWDVNWTVRNSVLVTTEPVVLVSGIDTVPPAGDVAQPLMRIDFNQVTVSAGSAFCSYEIGEFANWFIPAEFNITESIIRLDGGALVSHSGIDSVADAKLNLSWTGNNNFYEGIVDAWYICPKGIDVDGGEHIPLNAWAELWAVNPQIDRVGWRALPDGTGPVNQFTRDSFTLDTSSGNYALELKAGYQSPSAVDVTSAPNVTSPTQPPVTEN